MRLEPREPSAGFNADRGIAERSDAVFKDHFGEIRSTADASSLGFSARFLKAYPGSIRALEGEARVVADGGMWVAGAAWAAHFVHDYWLHTQDEAFLAGRALPFMEEVVLFFEDYLREGPDGRYVFSPTQSPENRPAGPDSRATSNATMDVKRRGINRPDIIARREAPASRPQRLSPRRRPPGAATRPGSSGNDA